MLWDIISVDNDGGDWLCRHGIFKGTIDDALRYTRKLAAKILYEDEYDCRNIEYVTCHTEDHWAYNHEAFVIQRFDSHLTCYVKPHCEDFVNTLDDPRYENFAEKHRFGLDPEELLEFSKEEI